MRGVASAPDGLAVHFVREGAGATSALVPFTVVAIVATGATRCRTSLTYDVVAIDPGGARRLRCRARRGRWWRSATTSSLLQSLELDQLVLVGYLVRHGGDVRRSRICLPGRVAGLVWVDVYGKLDGADGYRDPDSFMEPFRTNFVPTTRDFVRRLCEPGSDPDVVEWIAADMASAPREIALAAMEQAITNSLPSWPAWRSWRSLSLRSTPTADRPTSTHFVATVSTWC